ncbi:hypothetical protein BV210_18105 (plasmid) [Halorientalis sp. IM1011]|uniref:HpcH/HpaI aldolase/citrate lyase family protein n=1 Tax=Halorientalis sp. IM1011 TaxID=1932360 RepID=UPI00097CCB76|nr:CoA ester lyase [Halorientalis sp. IM1011]AQL44676.1 hypothetical protein BV210_18105 [Halorientalis sp. IM1011]
MRPLRTLLYIPANRHEWVVDAPTNTDADAFIFDLEDAVPVDEKAQARDTLIEGLETFDDPDATITVRVNPVDSRFFEADLDRIVTPAVDALVLPKLETAADVQRVDHLLTYLERVRGIGDPIEILALPETAQGFHNAHDIAAASDRVGALIGATSKGADVERALGYEWTAAGDEKQYMLSKIAMDGRAAGITQLLAGPWLDIDDAEGLVDEAAWCRQLGFTGYQCIHPSQVAPVNEIFTPDPEEVQRCREIVSAVDEAEAAAHGSVSYKGEMLDLAHVRHAEDVIERAEQFDI